MKLASQPTARAHADDPVPTEPGSPRLRSGDAARDADFLRLALAGAGLGFVEHDLRSGAFRLDAHGGALLGLSAQQAAQVERDAFLDRVRADDRDRTRQWLADLEARLAHDRDVALELVRADPAGVPPRRLELRGRLIAGPEGHPSTLIGTLRDVTEQRQVEEERDARLDELARTVRFSEMFVGILAQDLRNPLGGMMMTAQLAAKGSTDASLVTAMERIVKSGERVGRMVDQLLDFTCARAGSGIPLYFGPVDLLTLAKDVVAELVAANPASTLTLEGTGTTTGSWDADRLAQVLSNLIGNAIQHGVAAHGVRVHVDGSRPADVVVEVHNHGLIAPELLAILFNPFRAARQKRERSRGLGLGLYVTRQITAAHGGDVEVTSAEPAGTTFRVRLPRRAAPAPGSTVTPPDEMLALERFSDPSATTAVTARLFGAVPLAERAPRAYWQIFDRYGALLDQLVERSVFKERPDEPTGHSGELRAIADRLGALSAGAREVAELHARAIAVRTRGVASAKAQRIVAEGRLMAFELMGHVLSFYRRRAGFIGAGADSA